LDDSSREPEGIKLLRRWRMPRLVYSSKEEFLKWVREKVTAERYDLYVTEDNELIVCPTRSTQPLTYAYLKLQSDPKDLIKEVRENVSGISVYFLRNFEWATDRAVGIRPLLEE